jgi:hypothetical protein
MKTLGSWGIALPFLTLALDGRELRTLGPCRCTSAARSRGTHRIGGWVGPSAGLYLVEKRNISCACREPGSCVNNILDVAINRPLTQNKTADSKSSAFLVITPCGPFKANRRFVGKCHSHHHDWSITRASWRCKRHVLLRRRFTSNWLFPRRELFRSHRAENLKFNNIFCWNLASANEWVTIKGVWLAWFIGA